ncbi:hypothetical protein F4778DRAFT_593120 [Xylariomycetidae sp. FL2044]|nr:hypothetical protein F4778DRAFT_593120 [Xylariomycetidae sp. FL2044]
MGSIIPSDISCHGTTLFSSAPGFLGASSFLGPVTATDAWHAVCGRALSRASIWEVSEQASWYDCIAECDRSAVCVAVTFDNGTCAQHSAVSALVDSPTAQTMYYEAAEPAAKKLRLQNRGHVVGSPHSSSSSASATSTRSKRPCSEVYPTSSHAAAATRTSSSATLSISYPVIAASSSAPRNPPTASGSFSTRSTRASTSAAPSSFFTRSATSSVPPRSTASSVLGRVSSSAAASSSRTATSSSVPPSSSASSSTRSSFVVSTSTSASSSGAAASSSSASSIPATSAAIPTSSASGIASTSFPVSSIATSSSGVPSTITSIPSSSLVVSSTTTTSSTTTSSSPIPTALCPDLENQCYDGLSVQCDTIYTGVPYYSDTLTDVGCLEACADRADCSAYTYAPYGYCYLVLLPGGSESYGVAMGDDWEGWTSGNKAVCAVSTTAPNRLLRRGKGRA